MVAEPAGEELQQQKRRHRLLHAGELPIGEVLVGPHLDFFGGMFEIRDGKAVALINDNVYEEGQTIYGRIIASITLDSVKVGRY